MDGRTKRQPLPRWLLLPIGIVLASLIAWVFTQFRDEQEPPTYGASAPKR